VETSVVVVPVPAIESVVIAIKRQPTKEHELHLSLGTTTAQVVTAHDTFDHGREKEGSRRNVIRPGSV
jgi:hypothetical protein